MAVDPTRDLIYVVNQFANTVSVIDGSTNVVTATIPVGTYRFMMWRRAISRKTVLLLGFMLVAKSGVTMFLLQRLAEMAKGSPSLLDNIIFASQFSVVLYFVPILLAGIGVNMLSQVLMSHLADAERRFELNQEHRKQRAADL